MPLFISVYIDLYCEQQILTRGLLQTAGFWGFGRTQRLESFQHISLKICRENIFITCRRDDSFFRNVLRYKIIVIQPERCAILAIFLFPVNVHEYCIFVPINLIGGSNKIFLYVLLKILT